MTEGVYESQYDVQARTLRANTEQQKAEPALRFDAGKSRVDLIPPEFIEALGHHYGVGARKYAERNWERGMSWSRCYGSALRHMLAFYMGEEIDEETGSPHTIAAAWNMAALFWYSRHGRGTDDRPNSTLIAEQLGPIIRQLDPGR